MGTLFSHLIYVTSRTIFYSCNLCGPSSQLDFSKINVLLDPTTMHVMCFLSPQLLHFRSAGTLVVGHIHCNHFPNNISLIDLQEFMSMDVLIDHLNRYEVVIDLFLHLLLQDTALGVWEFRSKSTQKACSLEGTCKGYMFALEVTEELDCYPEKDSRDRKWVSIWSQTTYCDHLHHLTNSMFPFFPLKVPVGEAYKLCRYDWMRKALDSFKDLLRGRRIPTVPELSEPPRLCIVKPSAADHAIALCWWSSSTLQGGGEARLCAMATCKPGKCLLCGVSVSVAGISVTTLLYAVK